MQFRWGQGIPGISQTLKKSLDEDFRSPTSWQGSYPENYRYSFTHQVSTLEIKSHKKKQAWPKREKKNKVIGGVVDGVHRTSSRVVTKLGLRGEILKRKYLFSCLFIHSFIRFVTPPHTHTQLETAYKDSFNITI